MVNIIDDYNEWFVGMKNLPSLEEERESQIASQAYNGDITAINELIENNISMVIQIVRREYITLNDYDKKDLVSVGIEGLMKAAKTFNTNKNAKFKTYATTCIRNEIGMFLRKNNRFFKADRLERPINDIINAPSEYVTVADRIMDDTDCFEKIFIEDDINQLRKAIDNLSEKHQKLINMFYYQNYTQMQIAQELGVTQSFVSRMLKQCINCLKNEIKKVNSMEKEDDTQILQLAN